MKKIVFTGGNGRFCKEFKKIKNNYNVYYPNKKELNILNLSSIKKYIGKIKPDYFIHCAALSRPMSIHERNIIQSINTNIVGTSNVVIACAEKKIKLIYFSTGYVYQGTKGNYKEEDPVLPINNYAWSKLGGECAVKLYKNSLKGILNIGGKIQSVFNFAKKNKKNVKKISGKKLFPPNPSMNTKKLNKVLNN